MRYSFLIALREYAENVKTKGFWIGVILFPVMLWVGIKVPRLLKEKAIPTRYFALVDRTGRLEKPIMEALEQGHAKRTLQAALEYAQRHSAQQAVPSAKALEQMRGDVEEMVRQYADANAAQIRAFMDAGGADAMLKQIKGKLAADAPPFEEPRRLFVRVELPSDVDANAPGDQVSQALKPYLAGGKTLANGKELFSFAYLPEDTFESLRTPTNSLGIGDERGVEYWSVNLADTDLKRTIERAINREIRRGLYDDREIDPQEVASVQSTRVVLTALNPKKAEGDEAVSLADTIRQWAPIGFVYLLFVGIMTVVQMLLNNTIEEKSNRIIEVLLSSVTPGELMRGKLFGIAAVGFTMLIAWIAAIFVVFSFMTGPEVEWAKVVLELLQGSGLLIFFLVYFVLGYLFYAGIFLAIGSICSTIKEAQNFMGPIVMVMIVPLITMFFIPRDPNGTLATVLSWIPFYTPFVMMNRAAADPPMFDLIGTGILLLLSTVAMLWLTGKIFRVAILRTGQPPKLKELFSWVRA